MAMPQNCWNGVVALRSCDAHCVFFLCCSYSPQSVELEHSLKPFIPDFIPAVGDIDAFLKVGTQLARSVTLSFLVSP